MASSDQQNVGQPHLQKQDLTQLDITKLTPLSPEVISRQATINIGTIGHVAHGKSTVVKAISGVQTVRFKNELERNITIKLEKMPAELIEKVLQSSEDLMIYRKEVHMKFNIKTPLKERKGKKRKLSSNNDMHDIKTKQAKILDFLEISPKIQEKKMKQMNIADYFKTPIIKTQTSPSFSETSSKSEPVACVVITRDFNDSDTESIASSAATNENNQETENTPQSKRAKRNSTIIQEKTPAPIRQRRKSVFYQEVQEITLENSLPKTPVENTTEIKKRRKSAFVAETPKRKSVSAPSTSKTTTEKEYTVEDILEISEIDNEPYFLVKWKNYSKRSNTWEPLKNVRDCAIFSGYINYEFNREDFREKIEELSKEIIETENFKMHQEEWKKKSFEKIIEEYENFDDFNYKSHVILQIVLCLEAEKEGAEGKTVEINEKIRIKIEEMFREKISYDRRKDQLEQIKMFEDKINSFEPECKIVVENFQDLDVPAQNFKYINKNIAMEGVEIPEDPPYGCECEKCDFRSDCCGKNAGSKFVYKSSKGRLNVPIGTAIYECNKMCKCGPDCSNRVMQHGRKFNLRFFKTDNGRGWGVKTNQTIYEGQYITEYIGEIVTHEEAEKRGREYDAVGRTYLFDLDFNGSDNLYTIDAANFGNVARFINHSCDPNCGIWPVWIDCLDPNFPRLAFFALRRIEAGEELLINYHQETSTESQNKEQHDERVVGITMCQCGAENCKKYIF